MKLEYVLSGFLVGLTLFIIAPKHVSCENFTEEEKLHAVCCGFVGALMGFWVLTAVTLGPIVWIFS